MIDNDYLVDGISTDFVSGIKVNYKDKVNEKLSKKDIS